MKNLISTSVLIFLFTLTSTAQDYKNSANPLDEVGAFHNDVLNEFIASNPPAGLTHDQVVSRVRAILFSDPRAEALGITEEDWNTSFITTAYGQYEQQYSPMISSSGLSNPSQEYIQDLINKTFQPTITYDGYISFVKDKEAFLINQLQSQIPQSEYRLLLAASSVARHSCYLWIVQHRMGGYEKGGSELEVNLFKPKRGWIILGADVLGGVIGGGLAGAYYGSACAYYITEGFKG